MIHRSSLSGGSTCGKPGRISFSGADSFITCPDCRRILNLDKTPEQIREMQRARIREAAASYRARQEANA